MSKRQTAIAHSGSRIKGSRITDNSPIQGRDEVIFDTRGKATAVVECPEDHFSPNKTDVSCRSGEGCNFFVILASILVLLFCPS